MGGVPIRWQHRVHRRSAHRAQRKTVGSPCSLLAALFVRGGGFYAADLRVVRALWTSWPRYIAAMAGLYRGHGRVLWTCRGLGCPGSLDWAGQTAGGLAAPVRAVTRVAPSRCQRLAAALALAHRHGPGAVAVAAHHELPSDLGAVGGGVPDEPSVPDQLRQRWVRGGARYLRLIGESFQPWRIPVVWDLPGGVPRPPQQLGEQRVVSGSDPRPGYGPLKLAAAVGHRGHRPPLATSRSLPSMRAITVRRPHAVRSTPIRARLAACTRSGAWDAGRCSVGALPLC